ncbi:MAG: geranylgeranyl diphosphate synthase, type [Clostridia bacterium]|nr:geranylgeranyl diphosphate synthase, type [Clostridia bacterium]
MELDKYLTKYRELINKALETSLPKDNDYPPVIHQAMRYSLLAGGKRLRPILVLASGEAVGSPIEPLLPAACAVEFIHTYSLIHDDLPAMDDDDYRRGKPTCHKVYGEAIAILAGDALLTHAFGLVANVKVEPGRVIQSITELSQAAGSQGLIGGQVIDIESEGKQVTIDTVKYIHTHKTGSLIRVCLRLGAILGGANDEQLDLLTRYGENLGLAFQITDDILDVKGDFKEMGKKSGMDVARNKATYPAYLGLAGAQKKARELCEEAKGFILHLGSKAKPLELLTEYIIDRQG